MRLSKCEAQSENARKTPDPHSILSYADASEREGFEPSIRLYTV